MANETHADRALRLAHEAIDILVDGRRGHAQIADTHSALDEAVRARDKQARDEEAEEILTEWRTAWKVRSTLLTVREIVEARIAARKEEGE